MERRPMEGAERRHYLEGKRERAEALVQKVAKAKGLSREGVLKKIIGKQPSYTVRGPR